MNAHVGRFVGIHVLTTLVQPKWYRGPARNTIEGYFTFAAQLSKWGINIFIYF
jgi:hypothetical protein